MINTAAHLASAGDEVHRHVEIRRAVGGDGAPSAVGANVPEALTLSLSRPRTWERGQGAEAAGSPRARGRRRALGADGPHTGGTPAPLRDLAFIDSLQKKFRKQVGFLPRQALEEKVAKGQVSIAFENGEPAAYILGQGSYHRDPVFGIIFQAAVSYDARRRLLGTALVQHFMDCMQPHVRLIGLWCAQDIEANEFWSACGFEPLAARRGSESRGRVHIFWVGRTPAGERAGEAIRFPGLRSGTATSGGLMRARREVVAVKRGESYRGVIVPQRVEPADPASASPVRSPALSPSRGEKRGKKEGSQKGGVRRSEPRMSLAEQQRAFFYGSAQHICIVVCGVTRYVQVAPFDIPTLAEVCAERAAVSMAA